MTTDRRLHLVRIVERIAIGLVFLDVVLYFAAVQPIRNRTQQKFEQSKDERLTVFSEEARVRRLEWYKDSLPTTENEIDEFLSTQVKSQRKSFTRATRLIHGLAQHSGVEVTGTTTKPDSVPGEPLERMNITVNVKGPYRGLLDFAHGLETTSSEFFVIHDFGFETPEGANLLLRLSGDLYLTR